MMREAMPCSYPIGFLEQKNQNLGQGLEKSNHLERFARLEWHALAPE